LKNGYCGKDDVEQLKSDFDKKIEQTKDSIIISDIDPVIEICKIFNRAHKLHTTQVIPSGRNNGKVSNMTFREYTSFGGGTLIMLVLVVDHIEIIRF
jgi:hypothetical protein